VSPVRYELVFYVPEDGILHSHRRETPKSYKSCVCLSTVSVIPCQVSIFIRQQADSVLCRQLQATSGITNVAEEFTLQ
jgi:hypothetical protein